MNIDKVRKVVATQYVNDIKNLKQALNNGLVLKKSHRGININQKA